ncbi:MAG: SagB/ThcOx family dehydrogenase [Leptospirales bacterium]|nr:SagB/ThcOx family dehydrogenase [Leptospirales bacterium]
MKTIVKIGTMFIAMTIALPVMSDTFQDIALKAPDKKGGLSIMESFWQRKSVRSFSDKKLSDQMLANLLWAANGINRPADNKRTAPTAMNKQEIKLYAATEDGTYFYNAQKNVLEALTKGDVRPLQAPVVLIIVSEFAGDYALMDGGIVSQNISLFCAGNGLVTVPRGSMDKSVLTKALKLGKSEVLILNHPVGYAK